MKVQFVASPQSGISLVEVMVSITVGLFILAGVVQLYATTTQNSSMVTGSSAIQEHARLLFSRIENDVAKAGYAGCMNFKVDPKRVQSIINTATTPAFNVTRFVDGSDNVAINGKTFDRFSVSYAGGDGRVAVKQANADHFTVNTSQSQKFTQGDVVVVGDCSSFGVFRVSNTPGSTGIVGFQSGSYNSGAFDISFVDESSMLPGITYLYEGSGAFEYYVSTSAAGAAAAENCSSTHPQYCALFRKSSSSATPDELVEGVESFEVEYGWRDSASGELYFASAAALPSANWTEVDRIKITATLSSQNKTATNEGPDYIQRTYSRSFFFFNQIPGV